MSATYSTDSAGSSLSVDGDSENWSEMESIRKVILEENAEDYVQWGGTCDDIDIRVVWLGIVLTMIFLPLAGNQNKNFLAENIPHTNNTCRSIKSLCHHSSSNSQVSRSHDESGYSVVTSIGH